MKSSNVRRCILHRAPCFDGGICERHFYIRCRKHTGTVTHSAQIISCRSHLMTCWWHDDMLVISKKKNFPTNTSLTRLGITKAQFEPAVAYLFVTQSGLFYITRRAHSVQTVSHAEDCLICHKTPTLLIFKNFFFKQLLAVNWCRQLKTETSTIRIHHFGFQTWTLNYSIPAFEILSSWKLDLANADLQHCIKLWRHVKTHM